MTWLLKVNLVLPPGWNPNYIHTLCLIIWPERTLTWLKSMTWSSNDILSSYHTWCLSILTATLKVNIRGIGRNFIGGFLCECTHNTCKKVETMPTFECTYWAENFDFVLLQLSYFLGGRGLFQATLNPPPHAPEYVVCSVQHTKVLGVYPGMLWQFQNLYRRSNKW